MMRDADEFSLGKNIDKQMYKMNSRQLFVAHEVCPKTKLDQYIILKMSSQLNSMNMYQVVDIFVDEQKKMQKLFMDAKEK